MKKMNEAEIQVISSEMIFLDSDLKTQEEVLQFIVKKAREAGLILDEQTLYQSVKLREKEVSTAIGYDIAIPHGKSETVLQPFIAFLRTKEKFYWEKSKEEEVCLIFFIGVPKDSGAKVHLKFISELSKKLLDQAFREKLMYEADKKKIFEQLHSINI